MTDSAVPASRARATSSAFAAVISALRATRASAIASSAVSFARRGSGARAAAASRARRAAARTGLSAVARSLVMLHRVTTARARPGRFPSGETAPATAPCPSRT